MKMCFIPHRFNAKARKLVDDCDRICSEYAEKGYALTLRQLFYQLVTRNKITNTVEQYEWVGKKVTEARYAGELDWEHIVDRVRLIHDSARWIDAKDRLIHAAQTLRIDTLKKQIYRPEVWIEKDALIELAENVCRPWDIPYIAVKAYGSASSLWEARKRFRRYLEDGQLPVILHLGDLDFTGDDCSRFLRDRMSLLTGHKIELHRLALTPDQVEEYELPPQMGKKAVAGITRGDPRYKKYAEKFKDWDKAIDVDGDAAHVWELDALAPDVIETIIENGIAAVVDTDVRGVYLDKQTDYTNEIAGMAENYDAIASDHFKTWATLHNAEYTAVTPNSGIPTFRPPRPNRGIPTFQEMTAATAEEYHNVLAGDLVGVDRPISLCVGECR